MSILPATSDPTRPALTWRAHGAALFATFHLTCVILYALPRPPTLDESILEHPEVKAELEQTFTALHRTVPWRDTPRGMRDDVFRVVRDYTRVTDNVRAVISPYLRTAGSTQSWHMFGGTPPRFPLLFVVEVRPRNEEHFVLFQDLNWGTADSRAMNFRHRKVQELLSVYASWQDWDAYAAYWARRWDERYPDRTAHGVRLSYLRLTTPAPEEVRRGNADRHPEKEIPERSPWERPL